MAYVLVRLAFGIPDVDLNGISTALVSEEDREGEWWLDLEEGEPWHFVQYGREYSHMNTGLVITDSTISEEEYEAVRLPAGISNQRQRWREFLAKGCRKLGIPFVESECVWFASALLSE